jgi:hypothetical protein
VELDIAGGDDANQLGLELAIFCTMSEASLEEHIG